MTGIGELLEKVDAAEERRRQAAEARSCVPSLPRSFMRTVYDTCVTAAGNKRGAWERKKILFVLLAVLSPMTLAGERLRPGMRDRMARMMGASPSGISRDARKVKFYYSFYPDFRSDVDCYYDAVRDMIEKKC